MSFFDKLKRIINAINSNIPKDIKSSINNITKDLDDDISNSINKSEEKKSIPNIYSDFPIFDGEITKISEKSTSKYTRCILDYENISSLDFEDYLYDIFSWNYNACKLTSNFTNVVIDPEIKDILKKISDIHKEHAKAVLNILG